jgi:hypothetical protein
MVIVTKTTTKSSATLTRCSTMREPSGPEYVAYPARIRAQSSVGPREQDHEILRRILTRCRFEFRAIRARFQIQKQTMASAQGLGPRDKDHDKVVSHTYALQHHE